MEIEKEVKKMTLGHEFGAGASCLKCKDKCEGFELHFWRKICRNCKCGLTEHDVSMGSEENKKVGKLFEDTKYTGLIAKLKTDGIPRYQAKMVTITLPSVSSRAHSIQPHTASSIQSPAATAGSTQLAGASVGSAKTRASGAASTGAGGAASIGAGAAASTGPVGAASTGVGGAASPGAGGVASTGTGGAASNGIGVPVKADKLALSVSGVSSANTEPVQKDVPMKSVTLEWIPPVERKLAALYIELLPPERRPVAGTEGAAYRRKQMARQLPEHDQDPSKCHELSPAEVKKMQQFVRKYKDEALGVGDVLLPEDMALILAGRQASGGAGGVPGVGGVGGIGRATGVGGTPGAGGVGRAGGVGGTAGSDGAGGFGGAPGVGGVAGIGGTSRAGGVGRFAGTQGAGGVGGVAGVPGAGGVGGFAGVPGAGGVGRFAGTQGAGGVGGISFGCLTWQRGKPGGVGAKRGRLVFLFLNVLNVWLQLKDTSCVLSVPLLFSSCDSRFSVKL